MQPKTLGFNSEIFRLDWFYTSRTKVLSTSNAAGTAGIKWECEFDGNSATDSMHIRGFDDTQPSSPQTRPELTRHLLLLLTAKPTTESLATSSKKCRLTIFVT